MQYEEFLDQKSQLRGMFGFKPIWIPPFLYDFQGELVSWAIEKGRALLAEDCGLGKTPQYLVWSENVIRHTNGRVIVITPNAVAGQVSREAAKFGIEAHVSRDGKPRQNITITNYEQLHKFDPNDFEGAVCDESGILKNFKGKLKNDITNFMKKMKYRLLCSATFAPNDYDEVGTQSEALGDLGYMDMLGKYFKNQQNNAKVGRHYGEQQKFKLRGWAEIHFWRWICSYSRAIRKPSDLGYDDGKFTLPPLFENEHLIESKSIPEGMLFAMPAVTLHEQREERKRTLRERCEYAADLINNNGGQSIAWCHLNPEGNLIEKLLKNGVQISGKDSDEAKEEKIIAFTTGQVRDLVTKPSICAWGLNLQNCTHMTGFPSHSFEQYYQYVRRAWRFGQENPVTVDLVTTPGEQRVLKNHQRKSEQCDKMFSALVEHMKDELAHKYVDPFKKKMEAPSWMQSIS